LIELITNHYIINYIRSLDFDYLVRNFNDWVRWLIDDFILVAIKNDIADNIILLIKLILNQQLHKIKTDHIFSNNFTLLVLCKSLVIKFWLLIMRLFYLSDESIFYVENLFNLLIKFFLKNDIRKNCNELNTIINK
jgi:hypothetical protein